MTEEMFRDLPGLLGKLSFSDFNSAVTEPTYSFTISVTYTDIGGGQRHTTTIHADPNDSSFPGPSWRVTFDLGDE
jgi:hypothetical protein